MRWSRCSPAWAWHPGACRVQGTEATCYGPDCSDIHGIDESVGLDSVHDVTRVLALSLAGWCGVEMVARGTLGRSGSLAPADGGVTMSPVLRAASPVEIQARAEEAGLPPQSTAAALDVFHALTSRLSLAATTLDHAGPDWPRHCFLFGSQGERVGTMLAALRGNQDATEVQSEAPADHTAAHTLFAAGLEAGSEALLIGCDTPERLRAVLTQLGA